MSLVTVYIPDTHPHLNPAGGTPHVLASPASLSSTLHHVDACVLTLAPWPCVTLRGDPVIATAAASPWSY